jgi:LDH2 family malate/lactate/ureidoglycolate dehydrogenase
LRTITARIFESLGAPLVSAQLVADCLVNANLTGHDSHGVIYVKRYADKIRNGIIMPRAQPDILKDRGATAIVDGHWSFGQITAKRVMQLAIEKARSTGVGVVSAVRCNHVGRLGEWTTMAIYQEMVGIMMANLPHALVQPYGGATRVLGTNPFSVAAPAGKMDPFLLDFATSSVAEGKVTLAAMNGERIPFGWIVDSAGRDTNDPTELNPPGAARSEEHGRLITFGARDGHKGYCFSILMEILGGILTGAGSVTDEKSAHPSQNGLLAMAIDIENFTPLQTFSRQMEKLYEFVRATPVAPETTHDHVLIPGEYEWETMKRRMREGISVSEPIWKEITTLAMELGVA